MNHGTEMASSGAQESTQPKQRVTTIVLAVLAIVFLLLRLLARYTRKLALGADDWTLIAALVCGRLAVALARRSNVARDFCAGYCGNQPRLCRIWHGPTYHLHSSR